LGVPHETIVNLKGSCLAPATLADKTHFVQAHQELSSAAADSCLGMFPPTSQI